MNLDPPQRLAACEQQWEFGSGGDGGWLNRTKRRRDSRRPEEELTIVLVSLSLGVHKRDRHYDMYADELGIGQTLWKVSALPTRAHPDLNRM